LLAFLQQRNTTVYVLYAPGNSGASGVCSSNYATSAASDIAQFNAAHVGSSIGAKLHLALNREAYDCGMSARGPCADTDLQWFVDCKANADQAGINVHTSWGWRW
jgi:hypothetical protein